MYQQRVAKKGQREEKRVGKKVREPWSMGKEGQKRLNRRSFRKQKVAVFHGFRS